MVTKEHLRIEESRGRAHWNRWGPYLSERAWGTVREDYSADGYRLGILPLRARAAARLPLERRRPRRHLRPAPAHLLRPGAVERPRPHPQRAALRPDRQRGQSWRRRQGILLLPRQHAHPFLHEVPVQVSAGRLSLCETASENRARTRDDPEYELIDTGVFAENRYFDVFVEYAKAAPDDILIRIDVVESRARSRRLCTCCPRSGFAIRWSWGNGRPSGRELPARGRGQCRMIWTSRTTASAGCTLDGQPGTAVHRERDQRAGAVGLPAIASPLHQGRFQRVCDPRQSRAPSIRRPRHESGGALQLTIWRRARPATIRLRLSGPPQDARPSAQPSTRSFASASTEADRVLRHASRRTILSEDAQRSCGRRSRACCGPSSITTTWCATG